MVAQRDGFRLNLNLLLQYLVGVVEVSACMNPQDFD
jgi:hypothetical protein